MQLVLPEQLPQTPAECQTLGQWRDLKLGMSQQMLADVARVKQSRISEIERGHMPRRKHWPEILRAFRLEGFESDFYRMVMNAKKLNAQTSALSKPISETEPLLAMARAQTSAVIEQMPVRVAEVAVRA